MSRGLPPSSIEVIAERLADRAAPLVAQLVAELVAERFGGAPPLLDVAGAAKYLAADEETVRRWARNGVVPCIRIGSGPRAALRFEQEALTECFRASDATEDNP